MVSRRVRLLIAAALIFAVSLVGANYAGRSAAQADIERLKEVWPFVMNLQNSDRAFLAGLAMTCRLHRHADSRDEVVDCLRSAAADPQATLPKDVEAVEAPTRLEKILAFAPVSH